MELQIFTQGIDIQDRTNGCSFGIGDTYSLLIGHLPLHRMLVSADGNGQARAFVCRVRNEEQWHRLMKFERDPLATETMNLPVPEN